MATASLTAPAAPLPSRWEGEGIMLAPWLRGGPALGQGLRTALVPLVLAAALVPPCLTAAARASGGHTAALALPVLVPLVCWICVRQRPRGPQIHDRQMDLILVVVAGTGAVVLTLLSRGRPDALAAALGACLAAAAIVLAGWGARALWQARWGVALLLLLWGVPWERATRALQELTRPWAPAPGASVGPVALVDDGLVRFDPAQVGVLFPPLLGLLCGLGAAACLSGVWCRLAGAGAGAAAGVGVSSAGLAVAGVGALPALLAVVAPAAAGGLAVVVRQVARRRGPPASQAELGRRLEAAVPGTMTSLLLVLVLGVMFAVLGLEPGRGEVVAVVTHAAGTGW